MNRSSWSVGKRGTRPGRWRGGVTPPHPIFSVIPMRLPPVDDPDEELLVDRGRRRGRWKVGGPREPWPAVEVASGGRVHPRPLLRELLIDLPEVPIVAARADEVHARRRDLPSGDDADPFVGAERRRVR